MTNIAERFGKKVCQDRAEEGIRKSMEVLAKQGPEMLKEPPDDFEMQLRERWYNIRNAENGFVAEINEDWTPVTTMEGVHVPYKYIHKQFIFQDAESMLKFLTTQVKESLAKPKATLKEIKNREVSGGFKVHAVMKKEITFVTEVDTTGHMHFATGNIVDKKVGGVDKKFLIGKTMDNAVYFKAGVLEDTKLTLAAKQSLQVHSHEFSLELSEVDLLRWRATGQTAEASGHAHGIHVIDFRTPA